MAKTKKTTAQKDNIGISEANRKKIAAQLNKLLADESLLYLKTRKFHWNIVGVQFHDLHLFLENEYNILAETVDAVAERIRKMGFFANGSMKQFLADTSLKEHTQTGPITVEMLNELLTDHDQIINELRQQIDIFEEEYKDVGGADFLTGLMEQHEKSAWMLRATIS